MNLAPNSRSLLLEIARRAIRAAVTGSYNEFPDPRDDGLAQPAGCFVSLHESATRRLRGCIGRMDATVPLWQAVEQAAVAVLDDPRFIDERITSQTLDILDVEISVISPLRDASSTLEFDLLNDGIYLIVN